VEAHWPHSRSRVFSNVNHFVLIISQLHIYLY
jgi:hypothetical protein